ncbi:hypothetical protein ACHAPU_003386 [Fusarium lateritium]
MPRFGSFPPEIQNVILGLVADSPSLASYATINKAWQYFMEAKTFKSLILHQNDASEFAIIVKGHRKAFLKHLWLRIVLPAYPTPIWKAEESPRVLWGANVTFTNSVLNLWNIISLWDAPRNEGQGLTFELSLHSPSDWANYIKEYSTTENDVPLYKQYLATGSTDHYNDALDVHAEYKCLQETLTSLTPAIPIFLQVNYWMSTTDNLFGWKPLCFGSDTAHLDDNDSAYLSEDEATPASEQHKDEDEDEGLHLPLVPIITKFLIRRQQFRGICATALGSIFESLPNIDEVHVERWRCAMPPGERMWCRDANVTFGMNLPPSLKTLSLYGETSELFHAWQPEEVTAISLSKSLRQYSKRLENLSVSHLIDAKEFLRPFWSAESDTNSLPKWEHLKTLSLTSGILNTDSEEDVNGLLCAAARAARAMPNLEVLELWNGRDEHAGVFRYRVVDSVGEVEWLSTSIDSLDEQVIQTWNETSTILGRRFQRESTTALDPEEIGHTGDVLQHLNGRLRVMHPVSECRASQGLC